MIKVDGNGRGCDGSGQDLALRADIPKTHFKGEGNADAGDQQRNGQFHGFLNGDFLSKSALNHAGVHFKGIVAKRQD